MDSRTTSLNISCSGIVMNAYYNVCRDEVSDPGARTGLEECVPAVEDKEKCTRDQCVECSEGLPYGPKWVSGVFAFISPRFSLRCITTIPLEFQPFKWWGQLAF